MRKILFPVFCILIMNSIVIGQIERNVSELKSIQLESNVTYKMLDPTQDLRKIDIYLAEKQNIEWEKPRLVLGASLIAIADFQKSNTDSKFAYLMRHPTSNNEVGKSVSEAVLHSFQLSFSGTVNSWLGAYVELLYNPEQSFGQGTITALGRNGVQLRKGYAVVGDLNKFPIYMAIGKMDGNFGETGSVSPFTNSTMWHAYGVLSYGALVGFSKAGLNISAMLIQGGAQFRAAHTPVEGTNVPSKLNNLGLDANYSFQNELFKLRLGASYLKGSAYTQDWPVQHFASGEDRNPAYSVYGNLDYKNLTLLGTFASTFEVWPGTHNPNEPLNSFAAAKVSSLVIGGKYLFMTKNEIDYTASLEFSNFVSGANNAPWERQNQIILGFEGKIKKSSKLFVEVFHTQGYAPLNFISGGNLEDPGTTHSDSDARSTGILLGAMIVL
jgi:hypothetical protein